MIAARRFSPTPRPTRRVRDDEIVELGGRELVCVHTPGHTIDHLCLLDPAAGVLFSGDHVLPTITPHISGMGVTDDPLAEFIGSLDRMHVLGEVTTVLPAHGHPFTDLVGRAEAIKRHHAERLDALRRAAEELGPATVEQFSQRLFDPRSWGSMAESETYAHLEHLRLQGEAEIRRDGALLFYTLR